MCLGGTDIVSVAFERVVDRTAALEKGRAHFYRVFYTECMRIVIDHYRAIRTERGRGAQPRVELHSQIVAADGMGDRDVETLHGLLTELEGVAPRAALITLMRIFESRPDEGGGNATRGLTNQEIAELLGMDLSIRRSCSTSPLTVRAEVRGLPGRLQGASQAKLLGPAATLGRVQKE